MHTTLDLLTKTFEHATSSAFPQLAGEPWTADLAQSSHAKFGDYQFNSAMKLSKLGILYCPDYVINSGGITNAGAEFDPDGYNPKRVRDKVNHIYHTLRTVLNRSEQSNKPTSQIADELAEYNLIHQIGKRISPIDFVTNR